LTVFSLSSSWKDEFSCNTQTLAKEEPDRLVEVSVS
jgi:hypothetical protein